MEADVCIHIANMIYLGSYLVRDILWLRILTVVGLTFAVSFFCVRLEPTSAPVFWHVVFVAVNLYQIFRLVQTRREKAAAEAHRSMAKYQTT